MKLYSSIMASTLFAALVSVAAPVQAAQGHGGGAHGSYGGGGGVHGGGGFRAGGERSHGHVGGVERGRGPVLRGRDGFDRRNFHHGFGNGFRFRPRFGVGFGVFLGYPFAYPFYDPWNPWSYPVGPLAYVPGQGYGGVSFSISPDNAGVFVDGNYAGTVNQFNNPQAPLNLSIGEHHIEVQAPGYRALGFDVTVQPGQVIPYAGDLQSN